MLQSTCPTSCTDYIGHVRNMVANSWILASVREDPSVCPCPLCCSTAMPDKSAKHSTIAMDNVLWHMRKYGTASAIARWMQSLASAVVNALASSKFRYTLRAGSKLWSSCVGLADRPSYSCCAMLQPSPGVSLKRGSAIVMVVATLPRARRLKVWESTMT